MKVHLIFSVIGLALLSCAPITRHVNIDTSPSIQIGSNSGGIIEYMHSENENTTIPVDAVTGATKFALTLGVHKQFNIKGHALAAGLVYQGFDQSFTFNDPEKTFVGVRDVAFHQLRLPVTYNIHLFKNPRYDSKLQLKFGFNVGATVAKSISDTGTMPAYSFTQWDIGPNFGLAIYPYEFQKFRLGLFVDLYRGSKIYEDYYTTGSKFGNNSFIKFGINIHPFSKE